MTRSHITYMDLFRHIQVSFDTFWSLLTYIGLFLHIMARSHVMYMGLFQYTNMSLFTQIGLSRHFWVSFDIWYPSKLNCCGAAHCNTLQHTATHCNALQHTSIIPEQIKPLRCERAISLPLPPPPPPSLCLAHFFSIR